MKWLLIPLFICAFLFPSLSKAETLSECQTADKKCYLSAIKTKNSQITDNRFWIPLQVAIPVPNCQDIEGMLCIGNMLVGVRSLGEMIVALFQFLSVMIAVLLSVLLVIGGIMYIAAGGSSDYVSKAKGLIKKSSLSLLVVLFSVLFLYQLNPKLINPELSKIEAIERISCCQVANSNNYYFAILDQATKKYQCNQGDVEATDIMCLSAPESNEIEGNEVNPSISSSASLYKQCDSVWGNYAIGGLKKNGKPSDICSSGCSLSSTAMILTSMGYSTSPLDMWRSGGQFIRRPSSPGSTDYQNDVNQTSLTKAIKAAVNRDLKVEELSRSNIITKAAAGEFPILVSVQNVACDKSYMTCGTPGKLNYTGGHYVVITGMQNGKYLIKDPANTNIQTFPVETFNTYLKKGFKISQ